MTTTQRIIYTSKRRTTGLTDVTITIRDAGNTAVVSSATMTELASGDYYYDYTPTSAGWHVWYADSTSQSAPLSDSFLSDYSSVTTLQSTAADYATTQQLARFMRIEGKIPDIRPEGASRAKENVGTGDNSATLFYLDHGYVLAGTYTLYKGATESAATAMTETTHYTLDKDTATVTLTSAGVTLVGTAIIWASYSYCLFEITNTEIQDSLDRAQTEINQVTNSRWTDGTAASPSYELVTNETYDGKGKFERDYYLESFPLPDVSTTISGSHTAVITTLSVASTDGFLSAGTLSIATEKITYTGKTSTTFTGCTRGAGGSTAAAYTGSEYVYPYAFEISTTEEGSAIVNTILEKGIDYDIDLQTGRVHLYRTDILLDSLSGGYPKKGTPSRFRASYIWGNNTIPNDIVRLTMMIASRELMHGTARHALVNGFADFNPSTLDVDKEWIDKTFERYNNVLVRQT